MKLKNKYLIWGAVCLTFLAAGFVLGYYTAPARLLPTSPIRENTGLYNFIHPLLATGIADTKNPTPEYAALAQKVQFFIEKQKSQKMAQDVSIYFINYGQNGFFSLNEDERYAPASLLKVVIMVAYLKKSDEENRSILNNRFIYAPDIAESIEAVPFQTPTKLKVGSSYSVSLLIDKMIIDSDNGAMNLLLANMDDAYLTRVYLDLGLKSPQTDSAYLISAKEYSLFLRILYNATYLSKQSSEKSLSVLSKAIFKEGLSAGLPADIAVAHKFGEHVNGEGDRIDSVELHDCGIVYDMKDPYLLCVMTKGKDFDSLSRTISGISKIVYDDINSR